MHRSCYSAADSAGTFASSGCCVWRGGVTRPLSVAVPPKSMSSFSPAPSGEGRGAAGVKNFDCPSSGLCCFCEAFWISLSRTVGGDGEGIGLGGESEPCRFRMCLIRVLGDVLCDGLTGCVLRGLCFGSRDISSRT